MKTMGCILLQWALLCVSCGGFLHPVALRRRACRTSSSDTSLAANSKKGFGKPTASAESRPKPVDSTISDSSSSDAEVDGSFLRSIDTGRASAPVNSSPAAASGEPDLSPEDRTKRILVEKYGLRPLEEQLREAKQKEITDERRSKMQDWKKKAEKEGEFDLMTALPAPALVGIDRFLKGGVVVFGSLFVLAGLCITVEAWSKSFGQPLPDNVDAFIVNTVEPNFTPGLLVLLSFSVALGLFAAAQLGSTGASYKED